jgi:predicted AlkP superfamily phosphohydrolase/phosphomutase
MLHSESMRRFPINHRSPRVLVIGLDGGTYDVLMPLAEEGVMPNFARLLRSSALAKLSSTEPYTTPVAWTSFQTGCDVGVHGIYDYRYLDHTRGQVLLNHAGRIACPTLFQQISASGGEVVSIDLPMTYPPSREMRGIVVGGLDSPSAEVALAPYPRLASALRSAGVDYDIRTIWKRKPQSFDELRAGLAATGTAFRSRVTAALLADQVTDWRMMVVQFQALDSFQHRCWHLLAADAEGMGRQNVESSWVAAVRDAMWALDACLGELLELADRRGAAVVVLSDHGFGQFREKISVAEVLRQRELLRLASPCRRVAHRIARSGWKVRKWHARVCRGGSTASVRRPLTALAPIDWRRSLALAVHGELSALVYLNDSARFGKGAIVAPRQREQAEEELLAAFREVQHPRTREPLFLDVYSTRRRFGCDPVVRNWPDIVAIPAPGFHTRTKFDAPGRLLLEDPALTGTHRREGILLIQAPGAVTGQRYTAHMRDVAPTILHVLGLPPGGAMTGRVLHEMIGERPEAMRPKRELQLASNSVPAMCPREQAVVEQRLRDLGYLD